jgi:hypothetical protein
VLLVLVVAARLRRLPPRAPIQRLVSRLGLAGAVLAAVVSLLVPEPWRPWLVLVVAAFAVTACLAPVPGKEIPNQLGAVALICLGVAAIGVGVAMLLPSELMAGVAFIGFGVGGSASAWPCCGGRTCWPGWRRSVAGWR